MGKPKSQPVPDAAQTAQAQATANKETAIAQAGLNMINQNSPTGSIQYNQIGTWQDGTPRYEVNQNLSPEQQAIYQGQTQYNQGVTNLANQQVNQIAQALGNRFQLSDLGITAPTGDQRYVQDAVDASYNQATSRLDPMFEQQEKAIRTRLANQGINDPNSEAYKTAIAEFGRTRNDAYNSAMNQAQANGMNAAAQQFGMQNTAYQTALQSLLTERNQPINEAAALLGTSSGVQMPGQVSVPQTNVGNTDIIGANSLSAGIASNNLNQQNSARSSLIGALGGLGAAYMLSDRRTKRVGAKVGRTKGINVYRYGYLWEKGTPRIGVMAQDVMARLPQAVVRLPGGLLAVNYQALEAA